MLSCRGRVSIYYHPGTLLPTDYIRDCHRRYTPDFLVRHRHTNQAFLIEIKPRAFEHHPQLLIRRQVAENYIRWKKYDWQYKVVFDDEIILGEDLWEEFQQCCQLKSASARKLYLQRQHHKYAGNSQQLFLRAPGNKLIEFVFFGKKEAGK